MFTKKIFNHELIKLVLSLNSPNFPLFKLSLENDLIGCTHFASNMRINGEDIVDLLSSWHPPLLYSKRRGLF